MFTHSRVAHEVVTSHSVTDFRGQTLVFVSVLSTQTYLSH